MPEDHDDAPTTAPHELSPELATELAIESAAQVLRDESQDRLWLRTIVPILQLRTVESTADDRCQIAYDLMYIEACNRACRILRSDR